MEDILIYSKNVIKHRLLVLKVIHRLIENGLTTDIKKYVFEEKKVELLGLIISERAVRMITVRVEANGIWRTPQTVKDV